LHSGVALPITASTPTTLATTDAAPMCAAHVAVGGNDW
jgi:hypothetical protein